MTTRRFTHWLPLALAAALAGCAGSDRAASNPPAAVVAPVAQVLPGAAPTAVPPTTPAGAATTTTTPPGTVTTQTTPAGAAAPAAQPVAAVASASPPKAAAASIRSAPAASTPPPSVSIPAGPDAPVALRAPAGAPDAVRRAIRGANLISTWPYRYGGGHDSFSDHAYDCSGSVSYVLAWAGLLDRTLTSGELAGWGEPGPGAWITVYANAGHTFMSIAGWRYDTSFRTGPRGSRWQRMPRSVEGFTVRHWPGL